MKGESTRSDACVDSRGLVHVIGQFVGMYGRGRNSFVVKIGPQLILRSQAKACLQGQKSIRYIRCRRKSWRCPSIQREDRRMPRRRPRGTTRRKNGICLRSLPILRPSSRAMRPAFEKSRRGAGFFLIFLVRASLHFFFLNRTGRACPRERKGCIKRFEGIGVKELPLGVGGEKSPSGRS